MFTHQTRSGQDVVTTAYGPTAHSFGSRRIPARAAIFGTHGPIGGCCVLNDLRSAELLQPERIARDLVMLVGRSAVARDLRVRGDDRHVIATRLCL